MSDNAAFGFGKFVPGFDFLQSLAKSASQPSSAGSAIPGMSSWVAPTLSVEELDKRIQELKAVQFWLEQNGTALKATIQALEVQKMTLTTLQGMNVNMAELAKAFTAQAPVPDSAAAAPAAEPAATGATVDPMQWWGSLTQQFQNIASAAMQDVAAQAMKDKAAAATSDTPPSSAQAKTKTAPRKPARKKPAPRKTGAPRA